MSVRREVHVIGVCKIDTVLRLAYLLGVVYFFFPPPVVGNVCSVLTTEMIPVDYRDDIQCVRHSCVSVSVSSEAPFDAKHIVRLTNN